MSRLQPRPKSLATSNLSSTQSTTATAGSTRDPTPKSAKNGTHRQPQRTQSTADAVSDRATLILIRRTLCSQLGEKGRSTPAPIDEILPPLTSSNEVDLQLYAFIAIIIREFVQAWYTKITPDQVFVEEIVKILAHCTRALEQRLREVDLESLLFDELPELLEAHVQAHRAAQNPLHPPQVQHDPRTIYHSLWPFPALSPIPVDDQTSREQLENEAAYRQLLVQGVLACLLPTEDLENECLTTLVGSIFSEMILGNGIGGKASEPWLLWEGITKIMEVVQSHMPKSKAQTRLERSNSDLVSPVPLDILSGGRRRLKFGRSVQKTFWLILQYGFLAFMAVRFFIITIATASSLPSRATPTTKASGPAISDDHHQDILVAPFSDTAGGRSPALKQPILQMKLWSCVSTILDLNTRMPWLSGALAMLQWGALTGPGSIGNLDGMLDKILSHSIETHILTASHLPLILRTARSALFPNNTLAPPRVIPSPGEALLIRRRCAEVILDGFLAGRVGGIFFGPVRTRTSPDSDSSARSGDGGKHGARESASEKESLEVTGDGEAARVKKEREREGERERKLVEIEEILDVFGDTYCNKHLLYGVVELIIVRLIPELREKGVEELLGERLS